jgi:hypothetical protein
VTLREWALREGLRHTNDTGYRAIAEIVHDVAAHCLGCARWYMYRLSRSGRLVRLVRPGDPNSVTRTEWHELERLTRSDFRPSP